MRPIFSTFSSLLALLNIAAAAAAAAAAASHGKETLPHALQKRAITCNAAYGEGIRLSDCIHAMQQMPYYRGPVGGQRAIDRRTFGYNMRGIYTIPQYYQHDSCTILIDLDEPTQLPPAPGDVQVESSWADLHRYVLELIHNCVTVERGRGGDNFVGGFEIWLRNELDMAPDELGPLQDCIDIADEARTGAGTLLEKRNERVRKCRTSGKEGALSRHGIPGHQTA